MELSQKNLAISESLTLAIDAKAKKMKADGLDVVGFGAGEPDFETPKHIIEAAKQALDKGLTRYTPSSGCLELKKAICEKLKRDNHLDYSPNQIVVSNGAKHSLYNVFQAILNPGDEVIIPSPFWLSYPEMVKMAEGVPVYINTNEDNEFKITAEDLKSAITNKTKAIIINSPSNPTGCVYTEEELSEIASLAVEHQFFVVSDEIYEEFIYDGMKHISIASLGDEIKKLTILINGMSKAYAMTGMRIGYTAADIDVIKVMSNIQSHSTSNANSVAQYASIAALNGPKEPIRKMVEEFSRRRDYIVNRINAIPSLSCKLPKGAFYVMMNIGNIIGKEYRGNKIEGSLSFAELLLEAQKVAVVPGIAFGADHYVRLSYATSMDAIVKGLDRIEKFVTQLA